MNKEEVKHSGCIGCGSKVEPVLISHYGKAYCSECLPNNKAK
jgi:hypothetical protein